MSLFSRIMSYLGWCPGKKDASGFKPSIILLENFNLSFPFTYRLILFSILGAIGIQRIFEVIIYWVYIYPQLSTTMFYTMNLLTDIFQTFMGIGFILFAIDILISTNILRRHSKELAFILANFGVMKTISGLYSEYYNLMYLLYTGNTPLVHELLSDIARLASHVDGVIALYLSYRILRGKPVISRTTYKSLIIAGTSLIIWFVAQSFSGILAGSFTWDHSPSMIATVLSIISFSYIVRGLMKLYRDDWSIDRFLSEGMPEVFRRGFVILSVRSFLPLLVYLINPTWFLRGVYVTTGVFSGLVLEAMVGLMLIVAVIRSTKIVPELSP